ncbi:hypothetical protein BCR43DRAFT_483901 [Syncephalastrum racemosum]|uniref:Uncharacterized protein n=1 Tax=Syncephalastrum racemosum TaxID=13706 RepID=A0A1X2HW29_SYNRA|nr:hypothetical protein BCR43DRAFT_483901 [Syncephalastrum racemosum]
MSDCGTCGGCFSSSSQCHPAKVDGSALSQDHLFYSLLQQAQSVKATASENHDHTIPTIVSILSQNVYASQTALLGAYRQLELSDFVDLAKLCYERHIAGSHVAWAWEFCDNNPSTLLSLLKQGETDPLYDHLDGQAEVHEVFNSMPEGAAGRITRI